VSVYKCTRVLCVCMRVYKLLIPGAMHSPGSDYRRVIAFLPARRACFCRVSYAWFYRSAVRRLNCSALTAALSRIAIAVISPPGWIAGFGKASRR